MNHIEVYEPYFFLFFGLFHLHRIWGLIDRESYASFWVSVMESKGICYFVLMGILAVLCILGIRTFFKKLHHNDWWRWIYVFGGSYVLFDLFAIATGWTFWKNLILTMYDTDAWYWNGLWGAFIVLGLLVFVLGIYLLKKENNAVASVKQ